MNEGIGIRVAGAEDGLQGGVAVEKTRKMLPYKELFRRPRLLRAHTGQRETLLSYRRRTLSGVADSLLARRLGVARRLPSRPRRRVRGNAAGHARGTWQWPG
eukprot:197229-Pleurochrysis_carterae.AAC.1